MAIILVTPIRWLLALELDNSQFWRRRGTETSWFVLCSRLLDGGGMKSWCSKPSLFERGFRLR